MSAVERPSSPCPDDLAWCTSTRAGADLLDLTRSTMASSSSSKSERNLVWMFDREASAPSPTKNENDRTGIPGSSGVGRAAGADLRCVARRRFAPAGPSGSGGGTVSGACTWPRSESNRACCGNSIERSAPCSVTDGFREAGTSRLGRPHSGCRTAGPAACRCCQIGSIMVPCVRSPFRSRTYLVI